MGGHKIRFIDDKIPKKYILIVKNQGPCRSTGDSWPGRGVAIEGHLGFPGKGGGRGRSCRAGTGVRSGERGGRRPRGAAQGLPARLEDVVTADGGCCSLTTALSSRLPPTRRRRGQPGRGWSGSVYLSPPIPGPSWHGADGGSRRQGGRWPDGWRPVGWTVARGVQN